MKITGFEALALKVVDRLATDVPDLLRQAFRDATTGAPGPVHLELRGNAGQVIPQSLVQGVEQGSHASFVANEVHGPINRQVLGRS